MRAKLCMTWKSKAKRKRIDGIFCFPSFIHLFISLVYIVCVRRKKKRMDFIMMIMIVCVCLCERSRSRPEIKEQEGDICARRFSLFSFSEWERERVPSVALVRATKAQAGRKSVLYKTYILFFWSETSTVCLFIRFLRLLCCRTFFYYYYFSFPTSYCLFKLLDLLSVNWYFLFYSDVMMNYFYLLSESYGLPHFDILFIRRGWDMQQRPSQLVNSIDVRESESLESRVCVDYEGGGIT